MNNMNDIIKIVLVDDHTIFRDGIKSVLAQIDDFNIIDEAETGVGFLKLLDKHVPDIVLMDISMPEMDGVEATEKALAKYPKLKIITLSSYSDHIYYYKMIKAGVQGFVLKTSGKKDLEIAIKAVYKGENYFPQDILKNLLFKISTKGINSLSNNEILISKRETQVLQLICQGYTNNEIADNLCISPKTVDNHRTKLLSKTGTKNSAHLVMFSIKHHLIEI
jgi:DNA-binding NarL/FixJ family response regulator